MRIRLPTSNCFIEVHNRLDLIKLSIKEVSGEESSSGEVDGTITLLGFN